MFFAYMYDSPLLSEGADGHQAPDASQPAQYTVLTPNPTTQEPTTMYYRRRFSSFEEFQRESFDFGDREFGKDELELVEELEAVDDSLYKPRRRMSAWD
jgi:hypothetical protein